MGHFEGASDSESVCLFCDSVSGLPLLAEILSFWHFRVSFGCVSDFSSGDQVQVVVGQRLQNLQNPPGPGQHLNCNTLEKAGSTAFLWPGANSSHKTHWWYGGGNAAFFSGVPRL